MILSNNEMYKMNEILKIPNLLIITKNELNNINYNNKYNYIINFDDYNDGTHWVSIYKNFYFDSYGLKAPNDIENYFKKGYYYNDLQLQPLNLKSMYCGWFCLLFLYHMNNKDDDLFKFRNFIKQFEYKKKSNNKIIIYNSFIDIYNGLSNKRNIKIKEE